MVEGKHLVLIYILIATLFAISSRSFTNADLERRVTQLEFFEEATRLRDNLVGFKQVHSSLINQSEKKKSCDDTSELLAEWATDLDRLKNNYQNFIDSDTDAKEYYSSISKLNEEIGSDCSKLTNK